MLTDELNSARLDRDRLGAEVKGLQGQVAELTAQGEASAQRLRVVESEYEHKLSSAMGGWLAGAARPLGLWRQLVPGQCCASAAGVHSQRQLPPAPPDD